MQNAKCKMQNLLCPGAVFVRPGADGQADAGDAALCFDSS